MRIGEVFSERFREQGLALPTESLQHRTPGEIHHPPLHISFWFGRDAKGSFLDYRASNKFVQGEELVRIYESGEVGELPPNLGISEVAAVPDLQNLSNESLLRLWRDTQRELRKRKVCRSANIVADVAEALVATKLGLQLAGRSAKAHDAIGPDGAIYQVKARLSTPENQSRQLGDIHFLDEERPFDFLIAVLFGDEFPEPLAVYKLPLEVVRRFAKVRKHRRVLVLRAAVTHAEGVEDLTPTFRQDGAAAPSKLPKKVSAKRSALLGDRNSRGVKESGVAWVTAQLAREGLRVAIEKGSRLLVSVDGARKRSVQVISASRRIFSLRPKFAAEPSLIMVYVWHVGEPEKTRAFALTSAQALAIAEAKGWTKTKSWLEDGHYYTSNPDEKLMQVLRSHEIAPAQWKMMF